MATSGRKTTKKTTTAGGKASRKNTSTDSALRRSRLRGDIFAILFIAAGIFLVFALLFSAAGKLGDGVSWLLKGCFGYIAYALPFAFVAYGVCLFARRETRTYVRNVVFASAIFVTALLIESAFYLKSGSAPLGDLGFKEVFEAGANGKNGGFLGMYAGAFFVRLIGKAGLVIFSVVAFLISLLLLLNTPLSPYVRRLGERRADARARREAERTALEEESEKTRAERGASEPELEEKRGMFARLGIGRLDDADDETEIEERGAVEIGGSRAKQGRNRANIIDAVKHDDRHVTGAKTGEGFESEASGSMPGFGSESGIESATGFGLEPPYRGGPGLGLNDDADTGWAATFGFGEDARREPEAPDASGRAGSGEATDGIRSPQGIFTEEDIGDDVRGEAISEKRPAPSSVFAGVGFGESDALLDYKLPPVALLNRGPKVARTENAQDMKYKAQKLEQTLRDFKVDAKVIRVTVGPTVTRYEAEPNVGVKIQSIKSLEPDLALKLEVKSVRVVPMPGRAVVGIEAYNANTTLVTLREIIDSPEFRSEESKIAFVLGKNISGNRIIADLNDMPHLLIAGTTGSGKSVCINSILLSILYRAKPDEVKLILIDPKVVELKSYNDIPHLLVPVVTDPERAAIALNYAVTLMNERYKKFAEYNVRNLDGYNARLSKEGREADILPRIVIVIDELSDLMMIAPAKVQESISRLAAMARAAGMHLIVATQQPLASILTSVIKANIPSRIAFSVSSNSASRVILDESGAERLHGNGDMLFSPVGTREPMRIQGSFVSDSEVHKVTDYIKKEMDPSYSPDVMQAVSGEVTEQLTDEEDDLFRDAVEMIVPAKQASVSMIQRRFRIGYNRAARLVDAMEERGIVAASDGTNKPRKVLMTETQLENFIGAGARAKDDEPPFDIGDEDE
ncbi:MAG: DNA translocase FtsK [Clostridiales Family XIII bacterium]|jgi:S-DNA-T family DNA segregation ATPase FtsK/SpoIIIE|nr:DNA translocase FtsK [Clostridiales Family XIII bacterium]